VTTFFFGTEPASDYDDYSFGAIPAENQFGTLDELREMQASGFGDVFGTGNGNRPGASAVDAPLADMSGEGRSTPGGFCPVCNVSGKTTAHTFAACTTLSTGRIQCASDEYCGVEVRQRMQEITPFAFSVSRSSNAEL